MPPFTFLQIPKSLATAALSLALTASASAASFINFTNLTGGPGTAGGTVSGTSSWAGYDDVNWSLTFLSNSNGSFNGTDYPIRANDFQHDLYPYTEGIPATGYSGIAIFAGSVNGTQNNVGYDLTFTYSNGIFPTANTTFYIADVDNGNFIVSASNGGVAVSVSDWYSGSVQTSSTPSGSASTWNGTDTLVGNNSSNEFFVSEFRPTAAFDTLTFSYRNGTSVDGITFGMGDLTLSIPEPSALALLGLGTLGLLRRRRTH